MLCVADFALFFWEIHGYQPFPWQVRLLEQVCAEGAWPTVLDLPTGAGKTSAIEIAVFHLALAADRREARRAPVRIAFVVDRRLIVDHAYVHATKIATVLEKALPGTAAAKVAGRLRSLSVDGQPLLVARLRGGVPREDDWARTPSQPTVLCSTVDQVGSRLLCRGYGVSDVMKPIHAGLIGSDCLILLDEAHLAQPFRQTLDWINTYRGEPWHEDPYAGPWGVSLLTATPGETRRPDETPTLPFSLLEDDRNHPVLKRRLEARKPARLVSSMKSSAADDAEHTFLDASSTRADVEEGDRVDALIREVRRAFVHFEESSNGVALPAIGVVVNRVLRARSVFERIIQSFCAEIAAGRLAPPILMIGPARPLDRDVLATELEPIGTKVWRSGEQRSLEQARIIVATQCIEAGVDIDLDALVTEAAPLDVLRQRFGRLNRAGREIVPYAAIIATRAELQSKAIDPVYGEASKHTWERLLEVAVTAHEGKQKTPVVDFCLSTFAIPAEGKLLSPKLDAPVLLPAHVDLLSQTAPIPAASPDISLYLHGAERPADSITVVWRADVRPSAGSAEEKEQQEEAMRRLMKLAPPRSSEAIELPRWAVRRWLEADCDAVGQHLSDVAGEEPKENARALPRANAPRVFRWKGEDSESTWIHPSEIHTGETIIVPASLGGVDAFGWNPRCKEPATDLGREAAEPFASERWALRIAPALLDGAVSAEALAKALANAPSRRWRHVRDAVCALALPAEIVRDLHALDADPDARITCHLDLYGVDAQGRPRGVVFFAPLGVTRPGRRKEYTFQNSTEDDVAGSFAGVARSLHAHSVEVQHGASMFAESAGFPSTRIADLKIAGFLHDAGKADERFQAWLHSDDPLGSDAEARPSLLAKSRRTLPRGTRRISGLPARWRHEALSVRLAIAKQSLEHAPDPELVLWLVGTHHGYGRPFFPHSDPADRETRRVPFINGDEIELKAGPGPQSPAFDWRGADWTVLFERLKARYGVWELARMEATLRLADHRASQDARRRAKGARA